MNSNLQRAADRVRSPEWPPSDRQIVAGGVLLAMMVWLTSASPVAVVSPGANPQPVAMSVPAPIDELPSAGPALLDAANRRDAELEARMAVRVLKAEVAAMSDVEIWARTRLDLSKSE